MPADRPATRVLIITATRVYREGLARLLQDDDRVTLVGAVAPGDRAVASAREAQADVALLDIATQPGVAEARRLLAALPELKIVGVGAGETDGEALAWAEVGIAGCLSTESSPDDLVAAVQTAARGEVFCSPRMTAALVRNLARLSGSRAQPSVALPLTSRQTEILSLIERGLSNKEIARELYIEPATVKNHVHAILEKLQVHRRTDAAALVRHSGPTDGRHGQGIGNRGGLAAADARRT
jgi:two-component system, NarL family, nitrate/nitrite response regulator NarL